MKKYKLISILLIVFLGGCANYGTGPGGAITGSDLFKCGVGGAVGLILSNQITDVRRSSNKNEWRIASALTGCGAAPWVSRQFGAAVQRAVGQAAYTGQPQNIIWDDPSSRQQYAAVAQPTRSGQLNGRRCQEVRVSGVNTPGNFSDRYMHLCQTRDGRYEVMSIQ